MGLILANDPALPLLIAVATVLFIFALGANIWFLRCYKKVASGQAMILSRMHHRDVTFTGGIVLPIICKAEIMDIAVNDIEIERKDNTALLTRDGQRIRGKFVFSVGVNRTQEDILKVADSLGCERAGDPKEVRKFFEPIFNDALETHSAKTTLEELLHDRNEFRDAVVMEIGVDLNGFSLERFTIHFLEKA